MQGFRRLLSQKYTPHSALYLCGDAGRSCRAFRRLLSQNTPRTALYACAETQENLTGHFDAYFRKIHPARRFVLVRGVLLMRKIFRNHDQVGHRDTPASIISASRRKPAREYASARPCRSQPARVPRGRRTICRTVAARVPRGSPCKPCRAGSALRDSVRT